MLLVLVAVEFEHEQLGRLVFLYVRPPQAGKVALLVSFVGRNGADGFGGDIVDTECSAGNVLACARVSNSKVWQDATIHRRLV